MRVGRPEKNKKTRFFFRRAGTLSHGEVKKRRTGALSHGEAKKSSGRVGVLRRHGGLCGEGVVKSLRTIQGRPLPKRTKKTDKNGEGGKSPGSR